MVVRKVPTKIAAPSHNEHVEEDSHSVKTLREDKIEEKKMQEELRSLIGKYEEMARRMWNQQLSQKFMLTERDSFI